MAEVWHLPGLDARGDGARSARRASYWEGRTAAGMRLRAPRLDAREASRVAATVREAALRARSERTTSEVVRRTARVAGRITDPADAAGREAISLLRRELGWSEPLARSTLRGMAESWGAGALSALVTSELGNPAALDGFVTTAKAGRTRRAAGPPLLFLVNAGNVPGVAVTALIRGLLVRSGVLCKLPEDEPGLAALFVRLLAEEDGLLGDSVAVTWWPGDVRPHPWPEWVKRASKVVVYGGSEPIVAAREDAPAHTEIIAYGPRIGLAVILPDADPRTAAERLAGDVLAYAQQGCVSPRLAYVVGGSALEFARALASALEDSTATAPDRPLPREAAGIRALRAEAEFSEATGGDRPRGEAVTLLGSEDGFSWTVLSSESAGLSFEDLPRVVRVHSIDDISTLRTLLRPLEDRIQALGTAGSLGLEELAEIAVELGISRVAPVGNMAWPPSDWRHDGRPQLLPLLRWTDLES